METSKAVGLGLGMFSIGLGLAEVAAPGRIARFLGLEGSKAARNTLVAFGAREMLAGAMLLRCPAVSTNVWNRVRVPRSMLVRSGLPRPAPTARPPSPVPSPSSAEP
jgi:hypothetical protein